MRVIPLSKEQFITKENVRDIEINIPAQWWNTTFSINYPIEEKTIHYEIKKRPNLQLIYPNNWDIKRGDYRVRETGNTKHDFVYYRNLKLKILKYSIYPAIVITSLIISAILRIVAKF
jgi:hypothetical protein